MVQHYYPLTQRATTLSMEFREFLKEKVQDEEWLWSVIEKHNLNEHYPRIAKTMVVIEAKREWMKTK